jgi:hypothetical protein
VLEQTSGAAHSLDAAQTFPAAVGRTHCDDVESHRRPGLHCLTFPSHAAPTSPTTIFWQVPVPL